MAAEGRNSYVFFAGLNLSGFKVRNLDCRKCGVQIEIFVETGTFVGMSLVQRRRHN